MIVKDKERFVAIDSLNGLIIDTYSNTIDISFLATVGQYVGDNNVRYVQKCVKHQEGFYELSISIKEAEELLAFLKNAYIIIAFPESERAKTNRKHYSEISFYGYDDYDLIWCELSVTKDVKPCDVPYLIDDFYYFEYGSDKLDELIKKLEKVINFQKEKTKGDLNG